MTAESKLYWCPVCKYKWQVWKDNRKIEFEIYKHQGTWASPGICIREKCPECENKK